MYKQFIILLFLNVISAVTAQTLQPTNILKTKLSLIKKVSNKTNSSTSFGGMDINNSIQTNTAIYINVNPANNDSAVIITTFKKIKMLADAMGRKMEFDSDNPLTSTYAATEELSKMAGSSVKYYINKKGIVTSIDTTQKIGISPKLDMMQFGGMSVGNDCNLFLNINTPINIGDAWKDSSFANNVKAVNEYKLKGYEKGMAIVELNSTLVMDGEIEQMGMKMRTNQQGTMKATLTVNPNTLVIVNKKSSLVMEGTISVKGQSIPSKVTTETTEEIE